MVHFTMDLRDQRPLEGHHGRPHKHQFRLCPLMWTCFQLKSETQERREAYRSRQCSPQCFLGSPRDKPFVTGVTLLLTVMIQEIG